MIDLPIKVALIGAGRIGLEHAKNLGSMAEVDVALVCDARSDAASGARRLARAEKSVTSADEIFRRPDIQAVVICTPTDTHADLIEQAARAQKAIFCEKPVALDLNRTVQALSVVAEARVPFQIGFQRRFDTGYATAKERINQGALGRLDQFRSVGRDPAPPPREYLAKSGGLFIDQAVHDFDLARFLMGEIDEVCAWGAVRFSQDAADLNDIDTATTLLRFSSGALGAVENSRQAVYGYDIVTEVFGERGKLVVHAEPKTPLRHYRADGASIDHFYFFMDRFGAAFRTELEHFFQCIASGGVPSPGPNDALESLKVSVAATLSWQQGRPVKISELSRQ